MAKLFRHISELLEGIASRLWHPRERLDGHAIVRSACPLGKVIESHRYLNRLAVIILLFSASLPVQAAVSPLSFSIVPPVQFPPDDFGVTGVRLSGLWGHHRDLYGFDIGAIGNITDQRFVGIGVSGIYNWTKGNTTVLGLQLAGITNINTQKTGVYGIQLAGAVNYNSASSSVVGLQLAPLANLSEHTDIYGAQVGLYNRAGSVYGFQIGLVNVASSLHGIQIGLINFHHKGVFSVSPFINIGF